MAFLNKDSVIPEKGKGSKLSKKMELFVDFYFICETQTEAVLKAGYKTNNPSKQAAELMNHPLVAKAIEERKAKRREKHEITADYVLNKLVAIVEETEKGNPQAALRGLELIGKNLGMYKDKQEISGPDGGAIELEKKELQQSVSDFTSKLSRLARREGEDNVVELPKREGTGGT